MGRKVRVALRASGCVLPFRNSHAHLRWQGTWTPLHHDVLKSYRCPRQPPRCVQAAAWLMLLALVPLLQLVSQRDGHEVVDSVPPIPSTVTAARDDGGGWRCTRGLRYACARHTACDTAPCPLMLDLDA